MQWRSNLMIWLYIVVRGSRAAAPKGTKSCWTQGTCVHLSSGNGFTCSSKKSRCSFYRSTNSILNVLHGPSEIVQMKLLYSVCVPNYGKKKNRTVTSIAHKSFENSPSVLKFLLKLLFSIIKHHWKNQWPALNSLRIIDFLKVLVRRSEIQCTHIRIY